MTKKLTDLERHVAKKFKIDDVETLRKAGVVKALTPELAAEVRSGEMSLNKAYAVATDRAYLRSKKRGDA